MHQINRYGMNENVIKLILLDEAKRFIDSLQRQVADKIYYNIHRVIAGEKDRELFKKIDGSNIWEFRTLCNGIAYRLFAFWDKDNETFVIATHGIIKKTQKTPAKEIAKAEAIRKKYFEYKK